MKEPCSEPNVAPAVPSLETDRSGGEAFEPASFSMMAAAARPASESTPSFASTPWSVSVAIDPPAPSIKALSQTA